MTDIAFSKEEFDSLLSVTRRVVPYWLRQRHHTLSLAGQAAQELLSDDLIRERFFQALNDADKDVVVEIWLKVSRRIRDRLKKRIVRNKEGQVESEAETAADTDIAEVLDAIDHSLSNMPDAQVVFRELYVPLIDGSTNRRPSISSIQSFLGTSVVWAKEIRDRIENSIRAICCD